MADTKSTTRRDIDPIGSRYALEVAFRTMQERCYKLQGRLSELEEENTRLRLSERKEKRDSIENEAQMRSLRDIITQLEQEKKQLSHHVCMVTSENKQLWSRLSHSKETNKVLGHHLTQISDTSTQHPLTKVSESQIIKKAPSILSSQSVYSHSPPVHTTTESDSKDSLEEISLKLINSFLQEKSELEDQYAQMVALHDNNMPVSFSTDNLSHSLLVDMMNEENGSSLVLSDVKEHKSVLLQVKENLICQQLQLQSAVENLKKLKAGKKETIDLGCRLSISELEKNTHLSQETALLNSRSVPTSRTKVDGEDSYSEALVNSKQQYTEQKSNNPEQTNPMFHPCDYSRNVLFNSTDLPQSDTPSLTTSDSNYIDRVCPVCCKAFPFSTSFELLTQHVCSHFEPDVVFVEARRK